MKRFLLILITIISFSSCSTDNDVPNYHFEHIGITEVDIPDEFTFGETYEIIVSYTLPNSCYSFYNFDYLYEGSSREVYTYAIVNDDATCTQETIEGEYSIRVKARQEEDYIFKFWQGENDLGEAQYLIIEVPVI